MGFYDRGIKLDILSAAGIIKSYDKNNLVINDISFNIEEGDMVAVMGPSGSGKTTLLNVITGIDKKYNGDITIDGTILSNLSKDDTALFRRRNIGVVFQDFNLIESISVKENIMLPMILDKIEEEDQENRVKRIASILGIEDILDKGITKISGGQKQRVAIARAVINNPKIIFADEPTGNLDSKSTKDVMDYFSKINSIFKTSVLMVTHDVFAASYCRRVILIKDGKIVSEHLRKGSRKEFFDKILNMLELLGGVEDDIS